MRCCLIVKPMGGSFVSVIRLLRDKKNDCPHSRQCIASCLGAGRVGLLPPSEVLSDNCTQQEE